MSRRPPECWPLGQVSTLEFQSGIPEIQRVDRERSGDPHLLRGDSFLTDRVTRAVLDKVEELSLPVGYRILPAGEIESRQESFGGIGSAVIVATFMIRAILILEFGTFRSTLIVASVIPLGTAGGILSLQGEALYAPLAWVIIGGLITSTLAGRIVTPVLYLLLPPQVELEAASG